MKKSNHREKGGLGFRKGMAPLYILGEVDYVQFISDTDLKIIQKLDGSVEGWGFLRTGKRDWNGFDLVPEGHWKFLRTFEGEDEEDRWNKAVQWYSLGIKE